MTTRAGRPEPRVPRFTKAEIERAADIAKAKGVGVRLGRDGSILILPEPPMLDIGNGDPLDDELARWEERTYGGGRA